MRFPILVITVALAALIVPYSTRASKTLAAKSEPSMVAGSGQKAGSDGPPLDGMKPYTEALAGTPIKMAFIAVPVGKAKYPKTFTMGSPAKEAGRGKDEGPAFEVEVEPFWMGKLEVTWDEFNVFRQQYSKLLDRRLDKETAPAKAWVDAVSVPTPLWEQDSRPILMGMGEKDGYPVADISRFAAQQFTKWLSQKTGKFYRLPTEAEWEYAARAGTSTRYFFGDDADKLDDYAWTFDNSEYEDLDKGYPGMGAGYRKVGLKKANPWGFHDIYGNVSEWVIDAHDPKGYARFKGAKKSWRETIAWPTKIFPGVVRGGNWESEPEGCRSAARLAATKQLQRRDPQIPKSLWWYTDAFHIGFRIVRPLAEPTAEEKKRFWGDGQIERIETILKEGGKQLRAKVDRAN